MAYIGNNLAVAYPNYRNIDDISASFNGSTTSFALLVNGTAPVPQPLNSQQCLISVGGVLQRPDDTGSEGFRLSGGNIIFSSAPATSEDFFGVVLAGADYVNAGANFPDGQVGAPSITFDQDNDTGFYRSGSGAVSFTSNGVGTATIGAASFTAPSFIPTSSTVPANGVYLPAANSVAVATNGTGRLFIDAGGSISTSSTAWQGGPVYQLGGLQIGASTYAKALLQTGGTSRAEWFFDSADNYLQAKSGSFYIANTTANPIIFGTNNTERARIDSSGRLLVGTSSSSQGHLVVHNSSSTSSADGVAFIKSTQSGDSGLPGVFIVKTANDATSAQKLIRFAHNNGGAGLGEIAGNGAGAAAFASYSDARLKENVLDLGPQLDSFMQLRPVEFDYKNNGGHQIGFIAQEMQSVYPDSVSCGDDSMLMLAGWGKTEARLVKALQEAVVKIESLEARLTAAGI